MRLPTLSRDTGLRLEIRFITHAVKHTQRFFNRKQPEGTTRRQQPLGSYAGQYCRCGQITDSQWRMIIGQALRQVVARIWRLIQDDQNAARIVARSDPFKKYKSESPG